MSDQSLQFVNEGWSAQAAQFAVRAGKLRSVSRGIFAPADAPRSAVLGQALQIVAYRYPGARIMGVSALRALASKSPCVDGCVYVETAEQSSVNARRTRALVEGVDVVLRPRPSSADSPFSGLESVHSLELMPGYFERVRLPCKAQILWDAAMHPDCAPSAAECVQVFDELPQAHKDALMVHDHIARALEKWKTLRIEAEIAAPQKNVIDVYLQDRPIGRMAYSGIDWVWAPHDTFDLPAPVQGQIRAFVRSLLPEANDDLIQRFGADEQVYLREARRLTSLTFAPLGRVVSPVRSVIPEHGELANWSSNGRFIGRSPDNLFDQQVVVSKLQRALSPKISGVQPKLAAYLAPDGKLCASGASDPFTVIVKTDPRAVLEFLRGVPVLEWACQEAAELAGFDVPRHALMTSPAGDACALLSERFDVPTAAEASRMYLSVDATAIMGVDPADKYRVSVRSMWKAMQEFVRGEPRHELAKQFFDRLAMAWAMGDGDVHAKNISVLLSRSVQGDSLGPWSARLAPAYDTVCTRALPGYAQDKQALKIEGKDDGLSPKIWAKFGEFLGVERGDERAAQIAARIAGAMQFVRARGVDGIQGDFANYCSGLLDNACEQSAQVARYMGVQPVSPTASAGQDDEGLIDQPGMGR